MEKKMIYLVYKHTGSYELYEKELLKAFFNKEKAEKFKKQKEKESKELKERFDNYCSYCSYGDMHCKFYKKSNDFNKCKNFVDWLDINGLYYTLEEIEVE